MKSLVAVTAVILALRIVAVRALARPADNGPNTGAEADRAAQQTRIALDHGPATIVYVLIGLGAVLTLTAGVYISVRLVTQR